MSIIRNVEISGDGVYQYDGGVSNYIFTVNKMANNVNLATLHPYLNITYSNDLTDKIMLYMVEDGEKLKLTWKISSEQTTVSGEAELQISFENTAKSIKFNSEVFTLNISESIANENAYQKTIPSAISALQSTLEQEIDQLDEVLDLGVVSSINGDNGAILLTPSSINAAEKSEFDLLKKRYEITEKKLQNLYNSNKGKTYTTSENDDVELVKYMPNNVLPYGVIKEIYGFDKSENGVFKNNTPTNIKITGKNLFDITKRLVGNIDDNGDLVISVSEVTEFYTYKWKENTQYTISAQIKNATNNANVRFFVKYSDGSESEALFNATQNYESKTFTSLQNKTISNLVLSFANAGVIYIKKDTFQIEQNNSATAYEPYTETLINLPINTLHGASLTNTDACDSENYIDKKLIRRCAYKELTGTENWNNQNSDYDTATSTFFSTFTNFTNINKNNRGVVADRLTSVENCRTTTIDNAISFYPGASYCENIYIRIANSLTGITTNSTITEKINLFKAYLQSQVTAGTPLKIYYQILPITTDLTVNDEVKFIKCVEKGSIEAINEFNSKVKTIIDYQVKVTN